MRSEHKYTLVDPPKKGGLLVFCGILSSLHHPADDLVARHTGQGFGGSICAIFLAKALLQTFSGKGSETRTLITWLCDCCAPSASAGISTTIVCHRVQDRSCWH